MDWSMIGALGEIVGALGVIVSLAYLARSVRSSSRQERDLAARSVLRQITQVADVLARDASAVSIWRRGHLGLSDLSDDERVRMSAFCLMMLRPYEELFYYRRGGSVDAWAWESAVGPVHQIMGTRGFRQWWRARSSWFSADFRGYIDGLLGEMPQDANFPGEYDAALGVAATGDRGDDAEGIAPPPSTPAEGDE